MDDNTIRINNLRAITVERFNGKQSALAAHLQRQPDYISRLFVGKKKLGSELAREFEKLLDIPKYSLDVPEGVQHEVNEHRAQYVTQQELPEDVRAIVELMLSASDDGRKRIRIYAEDAYYEYQKRQTQASNIGLLPASLVSRIARIQDPSIIPAIEGMINGSFAEQEAYLKTK